MYIEKVKKALEGIAVEVYEMAPRRVVAKVPSERVRDAISRILTEFDKKVYVSQIAAVDYINEGEFELNYNLWAIGHGMITIRTRIPRDRPVIKTIIDLIPGALGHELEVYDLFGIVFDGNPHLRESFLKPPEMKGKYPLRKDFKMG